MTALKILFTEYWDIKIPNVLTDMQIFFNVDGSALHCWPLCFLGSLNLRYVKLLSCYKHECSLMIPRLFCEEISFNVRSSSPLFTSHLVHKGSTETS